MRKLLTSLASFSCILLILGGCGKEDGTSPEEEYIKIGLLLPKTGDLGGDDEYMGNAARLAAKEINEAGGLLGKEVKFIFKDSGTDSAMAANGAKSLIEDEHVPAIIGGDASSEALAIAPFAIANEVIQIAPGATSPLYTELDDNGYCWRTPPSDAFQGKALATYVKDQGYTTASILYVDNPYGDGLKDEFKGEFGAEGILMEVSFPENVPPEYTFENEIDSILIGEPGVVFMIAYYKSGGVIMNTLTLSGHSPENWFGADGIYNADFLSEAGTSCEGLQGIAPLCATGVSADTFEAHFIDEYGEDTFDALWGGYTYDAMALIGLAIAKAGEATGQAMKEVLKEISGPPGEKIYAGEWTKAFNEIEAGHDIDYQGASGDIDFDANGDITDVRYEIWKIENGEFVHVVDVP